MHWQERGDRTVVAAEEASPDAAEPVSSSSWTAVAMMGTLLEDEWQRLLLELKQLDISALIINAAGDEIEYQDWKLRFYYLRQGRRLCDSRCLCLFWVILRADTER